MMKWTKCAIRFLRISRPGVRVPSIAPNKIPRLTVENAVQIVGFLVLQRPRNGWNVPCLCLIAPKTALPCALRSALYWMPGETVLCLFTACLIAKKPVRCVTGRALVLYGGQYPFKMFSASSVFAVSSSSACDLSMASMMLHRSV